MEQSFSSGRIFYWVSYWGKSILQVLIVGAFLTGSALNSVGKELTETIIESNTPQQLYLVVGKSVVLKSTRLIKRASLANPSLADALVLSPTQLYLSGKVMGSTNLTFWGRDGKIFAICDVFVGPDLTQLKAQIHELFPKEKEVKATLSHDFISLSGYVSGPEVLTQIVELAESYAPKKVRNLLQVSGVQQVLLEVKVAEMAKGLLRRLGVNFAIHPSGRLYDYQIGTLDNLSTTTTNTTDNTIKTVLGTATNLAMGFNTAGTLLDVFISALKQHDLTKILAEPTLITISGQEANFLAGGQFPIPVPQAFGVTTIRFKKFGVSLNFNPTVMSDGKIALKVAPEYSELDFSSGISSQGITVPAILTRNAETMIELKDGQSFAIAGLLQDNVKETIAKYPVLGDLPILGALFRSTRFQKNETELVIIVTAHLVKPLDMGKQTLPTDSFLEPNDFEQMLMGYMQGKQRVRQNFSGERVSDKVENLTTPTGGGFEGQFGHLAP